MIPPSTCPYKELSAKPCWSCQWHNADMDTCNLQLNVYQNSIASAINDAIGLPYEDRLRRYEEDRRKLLELSKEALVDLILQKPTMF